ncbi:MAG: hypothetical protein ACK51F_07720 [Rhodospirillales bacterium]|jgi:hypothetical protein
MPAVSLTRCAFAALLVGLGTEALARGAPPPPPPAPLVVPPVPAAAPYAEAPPPVREIAQLPEDPRRRPGQAPVATDADRVEPAMDPHAVPPPSPTLPREFLPVPDRWRLLDTLVKPERLWDPYNTNTIKGDKPVFGHDWFFVATAISDTVFEPRRVPVPVGNQATASPGSNSTFGRYRQTVLSQNFIASLALIKGNTAYKPPDFEIRLTPVYNYNAVRVEEVGILYANPALGTRRTDGFTGMQEAFVDYHLRNVSDRYDFDSIRVGIQPFSTDFRGFLFQDNQLGVRLFGNRFNNRVQYNLAYFRRIEKDTNSGLNDIASPLREDDIALANLFVQDFPVLGHTSQVIYVANRNREGDEQYYDNNGFLVRPATIGDQRGRDYFVNYLGFNGDGRFGRLNLTSSLYYALGNDERNQFAANNKSQDIRAYFGAFEASVDFDWVRVRLSGLHASGDRNPRDRVATGFDAIFENPVFAGADTSYWIRQGVPLIGGGGVTLSPRNGVLPSLRSSKDEGQSNFVNPGLNLAGVGTDLDLTPEVRLSTNANYLAFVNTSSLSYLRNQGRIDNSIGWDVSAALIYRPYFTQNVVMRLSGAVLIPGRGLEALYETSGSSAQSDGRLLYSILGNVVLTF